MLQCSRIPFKKEVLHTHTHIFIYLYICVYGTNKCKFRCGRRYITKEDEILGLWTLTLLHVFRTEVHLKLDQIMAAMKNLQHTWNYTIKYFINFYRKKKKVFYKLLEKLESELKGFRYSLSDFHKFITQRIDHPSEYGTFSTFLIPCCYLF